jgi:pilus assembly protein Flp/PilA
LAAGAKAGLYRDAACRCRLALYRASRVGSIAIIRRFDSIPLALVKRPGFPHPNSLTIWPDELRFEKSAPLRQHKNRRIRGHFMKQLAFKLRKLLRSEEGPTAVEYAVMMALIVIVCLGAIKSIGTNAKTTFTNIANTLGS